MTTSTAPNAQHGKARTTPLALLISLVPHLLLVAASAYALYPVLWVVKLALQPGGHFDVSASPFPTAVSLENFDHLLSDEGLGFLRGARNSLVVALSTTLVAMCVSCTAGYALSRFRFPGRDASLSMLLLTQILPGVVMLIPLYVLLAKLGLLDALAGLVLVYATTAIPFSTWMLKGYFDTVPKDLEEAARVDGAGPLTLFFRIVLPVSRPALAVTALFSFMTAWNEFVLAATLLSDQKKFTLPIALQRTVGEHATDWGAFAAGAVLASIPVMLVFYALQKHIVGGLTAGSVKG
jgi:arabinogalactan oligomer/maltooligosaccharide transport system permease protein